MHTMSSSAFSMAALPRFTRRWSRSSSHCWWMTLRITSIDTFSAKSTSKTSCGIFASQVFSIAHLTRKLSSKPNTYKMASLWNSKKKWNTFQYFMRSSLFPARWISRTHRFFIHILLDLMKHSEKKDSWNALATPKWAETQAQSSRTSKLKSQRSWKDNHLRATSAGLTLSTRSPSSTE